MRRGLQGLRVHVQLEDRYFDNVAGLASGWLIKPSPDFGGGTGAAPFVVDLRVPGADVPDMLQSVEVGRNADGTLLVTPTLHPDPQVLNFDP